MTTVMSSTSMPREATSVAKRMFILLDRKSLRAISRDSWSRPPWMGSGGGNSLFCDVCASGQNN